MSISSHQWAVKERLLVDPLVLSFSVVRERTSLVDGHQRIRAELVDGSLLEFSEYAQEVSEGDAQIVTYSHHWCDSQGALIRRWDNTPHYPHLEGFPDHIHDGTSGEVLPGRPVDIFVVLDEIIEMLSPHP